MTLKKGQYKIVDLKGNVMGKFSVDEFGDLRMSEDLHELVGNVDLDKLLMMYGRSAYFKIARD